MISEKFEVLKEQAPSALTTVSDALIPGLKPGGGGIRFGVGAAETLGDTLKGLGVEGSVFLVSDAILQNIGLVDYIANILRQGGYRVDGFHDVEPEPHVETVQKVMDGVRASGASAIVGLGGGSVMDVSKTAALSLANKMDAATFVMNPDKRGATRDLPLILLPTTSGTGSEVSRYAVATMGKDKQLMVGPEFLADLAILDPLLTTTMPRQVTNSTGIDALTHAIESYVNMTATPYSDSLAMGAIATIGKSLRRASENPDDIEARADMLTASAMAMMSFNQTGGLWAHSVSYVIAIYKPVAHGLGCALGLPYLISYNEPSVPEKNARIAALLGRPDLSAAEAVRELMQDIGMPLTLREFGGLDEARIPEYARLTVENYPRPLNPRPMTQADCEGYWRAMFSGAL